MKPSASSVVTAVLALTASCLCALSNASARPPAHDASKALKTSELIRCFDHSLWKHCSEEIPDYDPKGWATAELLAKRGNLDGLIMRYGTEKKPDIRLGIEKDIVHRR